MELEKYIYYLAVPVLLYYGYVAAFSDIRTGRIPNRHIVLGVKLGSAWHLFFIGFLMWAYRMSLMPDGIRAIGEYGGDAGLNTLIAVAVGFAMWWTHLWAAGDAKLFSAFAFMTPVMFYEHFVFPYFPAFALLYNIFVCALAVVAADFLWKNGCALWEQKRHGRLTRVFRENFSRRALAARIKDSWRPVLRLMVGFVFSFLVTSLLRKALSGAIMSSVGADVRSAQTGDPAMALMSAALNSPMVFLAFFLLYRPISKLFENPVLYYMFAASIVGYILYSAVYSGNPGAVVGDVAHFGGLSGLLILFRKGYEYYAERVNVKTIPLDELGENMILSRRAREALKGEKELFPPESESEEDEAVFYADGLTAEQVRRLKEWGRMDPVEVSGTIPFAPCIFLGVAATVATKGLLLGNIILGAKK